MRIHLSQRYCSIPEKWLGVRMRSGEGRNHCLSQTLNKSWAKANANNNHHEHNERYANRCSYSYNAIVRSKSSWLVTTATAATATAATSTSKKKQKTHTYTRGRALVKSSASSIQCKWTARPCVSDTIIPLFVSHDEKKKTHKQTKLNVLIEAANRTITLVHLWCFNLHN